MHYKPTLIDSGAENADDGQVGAVEGVRQEDAAPARVGGAPVDLGASDGMWLQRCTWVARFPGMHPPMARMV